MKILCTFCSKEKVKNEGFLPAWKRYTSARILSIRDTAHASNIPFFILSGKHGLISENKEIEYYDHLLSEDSIQKIVSLVVGQIKESAVTEIIFYTRPEDTSLLPYLHVLEQATKELGIQFTVSSL